MPAGAWLMTLILGGSDVYIFDEKFKSGAKRARRAEKGLTSLLEGMNKLLPEPVNFKRCENNKNFDSSFMSFFIYFI